MEKKLFLNGNFITLNEKLPAANYLLSNNGIIEDIGISDSIRMKYADAHVIDLKGKTIIPGFIDSHMHMLTGALTKFQIDLNDIEFNDIDEVMKHIKDNTASSNNWIRAFGLNEELLKHGKLPQKEDIDKFFPDRPVIITRVCGHLSIINSKALDMFDKEGMDNIVGGEFGKRNGIFTGVVTEAAQQYVLDRIPAPDDADILKELEIEQDKLIKQGICSIHDAGTDQIDVKSYVNVYLKFSHSGRLKIRTYLMVRPMDSMDFSDFCQYANKLREQYTIKNNRLFFGAIKLFADGSIGGKTAAVINGYSGDSNNKGLLLKENLDKYIKLIHDAGFQLAIHAIGDKAVEYSVNLIGSAIENKNINLRHRIEHAELSNNDILDKIKKYNISIMTQPGFISEFGNSYIKNLGMEGAMNIQPLKDILYKNINLGFGTDFPVINPNPIRGIDSAVNRIVKDTNIILNKNQCIDIIDGIKCYTIENAYASNTEDFQGSLEVGKYADFVVLNSAMENIKSEEIKNIEVVKTVINGEILYEKQLNI